MGDLIEITTLPQDRTAFYKVSSGGLKVQIKGEGSAVIGLVKKLDVNDSDCDFLIVIGHSQRSWIKKSGGDVAVANTPNILSSLEYRSFWVLWNSRSVSFGREGDSDPIVTYRNVVKPLNHVMFGVKGGFNSVYWRFELAPIIPKPELKSLSGGKPTWQLAGVQLPHGAVVGGYENGTLYVIRARHRDSLTPGKFVPSEGEAFISWGGAEHEKEDFEVLVGYNFVWVPAIESKIPVGAVVGGYTEGNVREKLFIGRVRQDNHIIPGKVQPSHSACYVPYRGRECAHRDFEVLVSMDINNRCSNTLFYSSAVMNADTPTDSDDDDQWH